MAHKGQKSIKTYILMPVIVLGILATISSLLGYMSINNLMNTATRISDEYMVSVELLGDIKSETESIHKSALSHIIALDLTTKLDVAINIKEESKELKNHIAQYESYVLEEDREVFNTLVANCDEFEKGIAQLIALSVNGKTTLAYSYANNGLKEITTQIQTAINQLVDANNSASDAEISTLQKADLGARLINIITIITVIIVMSLIIVSVTKRVIRPIAVMEQQFSLMCTEIMEKQGDLTKRVDIHSDDEIGLLGQGINMFLDKLQHTFSILKKTSQQMEVVVNDVFESVNASNQGAASLSVLTKELSSAMQETTGELISIQGNATAVQNDITAIAEETHRLNDYAMNMKQNAYEVKAAAHKAVEEINNKVNEILSVLNEAIEDSKSVNQVDALTGDILSITSQTNLLALNASIEAARAGDAGKGFSVVAEEIRGLADSSRETANNIQEINMIVTKAVNNLSQHAKSLTEYLTDSILPEFNNFVQVGEQYMQRAEYIEGSMCAFRENTDELTKVMGALGNSVDTIVETIEDSAQGINGVANNVEDLVDDMDTITMRMNENKEIATELKTEAEIFKKI